MHVHLIRLRTLTLCATAAAGLLALVPAAALASSVSVKSGVLAYTAASGEANVVAIAPAGTGYQVTETGTRLGSQPIAVTAGAGCSLTSPGHALCSGVKLLAVATGDGNDTIDVSRAPLPGGIDCGAGADTVTAGAFDIVMPDCESVQRLPSTSQPATGGSPGTSAPAGGGSTGAGDGSAQPGGGSSPGTGASPTAGHADTAGGQPGADPSAPVIQQRTATVTPQGQALVQVVCPAASNGCQGTVTLEVAADVLSAAGHGQFAVAARRRKMVTIGAGKFRAKAGQKVIVRVKLARRGRWRVIRGHRVHCRVTITTRTPGGKVSATTSQITLVAGPARRGKRGK